MNLATQLAPIELLDPDEKSHKLGDFWRDQPVVLVFVRHFG